ncbi:MAG: acylphosphatase [Pseudomonadota bacterium]
MTAAEIRLMGAFNPSSFKSWICARARLLDLNGSVTSHGTQTISILVQGPQALIDAMEMACSLGPMDAMVDRVEVTPNAFNGQLKTFRNL